MLPGLVPPTDARALLFDCDGTLVETQSLYRMCWRQVFGRHGFDMSDEWFAIWAGHSVRPFVLAAFPGIDDDLLYAIADEGIALFLQSTHLLEPLEHVVEIARQYRGVLPMAVVSGGPRSAVHDSLVSVGILELFDHVVTVDDVATGKPAPDAYILAAELLGLTPAECVAYEDSTSGLTSARDAGIGTIIDIRQHDPGTSPTFRLH